MSGGKGGDTKRNFTELVMDLTDLSGMYRFCLPPYMVFIIRSITTLDFCAVRTNCNMYEVAAPVAIWRALTPRTKSGAHTHLLHLYPFQVSVSIGTRVNVACRLDLGAHADQMRCR